jgi:ubiquinone/menaquinone biosynthesis C-methylase UbiE
MQKWKKDPTLYDCDRIDEGLQAKKKLDYYDVYVEEFLNSDPVRDWESIERCKMLWEWALRKIGDKEQMIDDFIWGHATEWKVLDCGTKDGQFPEFLSELVGEAKGIEISSDYINFAQSKGRPVIYGDICSLPEEWTEVYDFVFSHHVLGLTNDYTRALEEMYRVVKPGGYMLTCNDVPGNPRKHFAYIRDSRVFDHFSLQYEPNVVYSKYWSEDYIKEWVYLIQKPESN